MKADIESSSVTEVSLKSCAKITLKDTGVSINLNNTYPMSKNKALQTTPYTFTVSSSCENYVGFNLYLATLNTNTLDASNIHYIITNNGSKDILAEGILSNATNAESEFSNEEKTQLNSGINGTYSSIYKLYNDSIPLQGEKSYDLYLYVDGNVTDASTMNKSFKAGIAVKSYDREADSVTLANYIINEVYTGVDGENGLYYHDGVGTYTNADQEAGDNSYRYSGANPNNYVCFGSDAETCPDEYLYRIIGVFDGKIKLIMKNTYETNVWNNGSGNNWENASVNLSILNDSFYNSLSLYWQNMIFTSNWGILGLTSSQRDNTPFQVLSYEISNLSYLSKIGLMYISDYGFATSSTYWNTMLNSYNSSAIKENNWLYTGLNEWTITRHSEGSTYAFQISSAGNVNGGSVTNTYNSIRPAFYLKSDVIYVSGDGTQNLPYKISY